MRRCWLSADRGSATVLMLAITGLVVVLTAAVAQLGMLVAARNQASTAADAAALAAAVATYPATGPRPPRAAAALAAHANGAEVETCRCPVDRRLRTRSVEVVTSLEVDVPLFGDLTVRSAARAEFDPRAWLGR